jgi:FkbH-like protein
LHELSNKTNQFNTNLLRLSEAEILRRMENQDHRVVSVQLSDRLSESGIIGAVFGFVEGNELLIDEICISCRALGRQIESVFITEAIRGMTVNDDISRVSVFFRSGPRNQPALNWLGEYCAQNPLPDKIVSIPWDAEAAGKSVSSTPVRVIWGIPDGT